MLIFELPSTPDSEGLRVSTLGSCRVHIPLRMLADRGELSHCAQGMSLTFTAAEALQIVDLMVSERRIPDALCPFVFGADRMPAAHLLRRSLRRGLDAVLVEVSDLRQFRYGDTCLRTNLFTRNFVRSYGGALLPWFRQLCSGQATDEASVQAALEGLRESGQGVDEQVVDLLRGVRMEIPGCAEIVQALDAMMSMLGGRWTVIGALEAPGHEGQLLRDRRALNDILERAARECGAVFYNPTRLIIDHGRATVMDRGGADVYEYAPDFYPMVAETWVRLARRSSSPAKATSVGDAPATPPLFSKSPDRPNWPNASTPSR